MPAREECTLRPMEERDLDMVLGWRNSERIRRVSYTDHVIGVEEHRAWFERIEGTEDAVPFVFECEGRPVGVVNVTDIGRTRGSCSWGFYIGAEDAPPGAGRAMGFCALEHLFEHRGLRRVRGEAMASNEASIRYHRRLGFEPVERLVGHTEKNGILEDVLAFVIREPTWIENREALFETTFDGRRQAEV